MNTLNNTLKAIIIASFGMMVSFGSISATVSAEPFRQHQNISEVPLTSLKCNEFTFDATRSQLPESSNISFLWNFGDGATSTNPTISHTYAQSGNYTVTLSITDNSGFKCSTATKTQPVHVNIPPRASFISEDQACVNKLITLDASASNSDNSKNLGYLWEFGDGSTLSGDKRVKKAYSKGGDYRVSLTVDDLNGTFCSTQTVEKIVHINEPPVAQAGDDIVLKCTDGHENITINFDASATTDANNDLLTYLWDFGDGHIAKGVMVSHQYSKIGNFEVKLLVSDNTNLNCAMGVDFVYVKINQAPRANAGEDIMSCPNEDITFDSADSYVHTKGTIVALWYFGDGFSGEGLSTTHQYRNPGTYQATLSMENKLNATCPISRDTRAIVINSPPTVNIKSVASECVGKEIFFDASSAMDADGDNLQYYWNFGDGTTSQSGAKVSHVYTQGGNHRISVIVDDQKRTSCSTATATTTIHINTPPIADAGSNLSCCAQKSASFSANASSDPDGDRLTYMWEFGDGSQQQGETVTHAYAKSGSYNVKLTIDDRSGSACSQSTDSFVAVVKDVPIPVIDIR